MKLINQKFIQLICSGTKLLIGRNLKKQIEVKFRKFKMTRNRFRKHNFQRVRFDHGAINRGHPKIMLLLDENHKAL